MDNDKEYERLSKLTDDDFEKVRIESKKKKNFVKNQ